ncbi:DUF2929 family protein [Lentibacillus saliphilus]|uniref:DUF2929 family protein n=1 Tax=Lentibacillus saliphilus TaxID=2737028 RepID=UPI001C300523|nr:DUF2929 family protein [Lentibacillus saliphilus]
MRYIVTMVWSLLIGAAVSYVLSSMAGAAFELSHGLITGVIIGIGVLILGEGVLKGNTQS